MPIYEFECDRKKDGCGHKFEKKIAIIDYDVEVKKTKCPNCNNKKSIIRIIGSPIINFVKNRTVGAVADNNTSKISSDNKHYLTEKHNKHKKEKESKPLPDGMVRGKDLV